MAYGNVSRAAFGIFVAYLCFATYQWFTLYLARRKFIIKEGCKPIQGHYPHTDKILGTDYLRDAFAAKAKGELLIRESGLFDRLGATYMFRVFGMGVISTAEPENIKAIFATKFNDFSTGERNRVLEPLLGTGIFTTDGDLWAHSRVMIRPNFTRSQISDLNRLEAHVQELFQLIPPDGHEVDLQPLFFRLMMDSATDFLFGQSAHSLREEIKPTPGRPSGTAFAHAFDLAQEYCNVRFLYGPVGRIMWQPKEDRDAIATCRSFVEPYVDEAVRYRQDLDAGRIQDKGDDVKKQYTFLYELAKETKDRIRLRDEVMNLLVAGRDTTASFLSNLFHHLAKRPEIWTRLRDEVATLDGALPTFEQLKNMKYLQQCIKESLRLDPPVPGLARESIKDTVLPMGGGPDGKSPLFIKKGTLLMPMFYGMHRRKDLYGPDSHQFDPDRWEKLRPGWEYTPFSGGPRICLGQQYALTEAGYVIVRFLQEFHTLQSRDPGPLREQMTLTCASLNGVKVALTRA